MKNSTRFNGAPPARVPDHRQAKILLPEHHPARVGAKPKSSRPIVERPMHHLAWYVPLKTKESERKTPRIHQIKWIRPPKISLNPEWQVAAGEESKLTAVTPSSPLTWPLVEADCHDDSQTPIIPIIPIEEVGAEMPSDTPVTAITSANPQPSASCPSVAECPNQHVHEKSLPHRLHGLEGDDLIAAGAAITFAALMQNRTIDNKLVVKYLTDLDLIEKVKSGDGLASKPEDEAQPASKSNTCLHLPSLTLTSMVEKLINVCIEPVRKASLSDSTPQTVNQSLILPSSKDETCIKKCTSKLGGIGSGSHLSNADRQSLFLSCTKFVSDINICASKLGGMHAGSGLSRQRADNQTPLPCSKAETEIKAASKSRGMCVGNGLSTPKADNQSQLPPCSKAETEISKTVREPGRMRAESAGSVLSRQRAENQTPSLPCSKAETDIKAASKPGGMHVRNGLSTPKADNQSLSPPCSKDEAEINKTVREPGRMRAESGTCTVKVEDQSSLFPCSKSVLGIDRRASILGDLNSGSGFKKLKAENRSPLLPCSKAGTTINKAVGKPGGTHAVSGQSTPKTYNQSPLLPCTKAFTESNNGASKLGGMRAVSGSHSQKADYQSPLLPCSNAETKISKTVRKPGGMCDGSGLGTSQAAVSEIKSCASKLGGVHAGPGTSKEAASEINGCASTLGGMLAGSGPPTTKGEKRRSPSPGLNSDRPTKKLTGESGGPSRPCTDQIVREQKAKTLVSKENEGSDFTGVKPVNSLSPYPSKPKMKDVKKMIHDYGSYDVAQVKPVAPPSVLPNEEMDRMLEKYLLLDRGWREPFVGPSPRSAPSPVTNLHACPNAPDPYFNGTGTFHLSLQPMSPGRQVDLQYHQPQIQRRGEIPNIWHSGNYSQGHNINRRIEMNPIYQRPCMHFSNPARSPNGYNFPYQHDVSRQWSGRGDPPGEPWWPRR